MTEPVPLVKLKRGERAAVAALPRDEPYLRKLLVFGLLPGVQLTVDQTFPGYVLAVGNTMLALDREIAGRILVKKLG